MLPFVLKKNTINYIIQQDKTKHNLAHYLHFCAFSPCISTFKFYIKKENFITWPGIDNINFNKIVRKIEATVKGHLN